MSAVDAAQVACHVPAGARDVRGGELGADRVPVIVLVGRPNVGKSTFFARATGRYAETSNVPGTTIGSARRTVTIGGQETVIVDLPGSLTLHDVSDGLVPFWRMLTDERPDAVLALVDAGELGRHLPLVLACRDLGLPIVLAANLADEAAARGINIDTGRLSQLLGGRVVLTVGREGKGVDRAVAEAARVAARAAQSSNGLTTATPAHPYGPEVVGRVNALARAFAQGVSDRNDGHDLLHDLVSEGRLSPIAAATIAASDVLEPARWSVADAWARDVEQRRDVPPPLADRFARLATSPWPGLPLFALVTFLALAVTTVLGTLLSTALANAWSAYVSPVIGSLVSTVVPSPPVARALLWAIDSGLLAMLSVGIPFVLTFYLVLAILEDSGYLASTAVLTDRVFNAFGLPGRAAIPILVATGCNVPAVYGTRVLDSRRERLIASFLIVLVPCSARSAVVFAAVAPFIGVAAALAAFGVVAAVTILAGIASNALVPGRQSPLVLELPPLRRPLARHVAAKAWFRFRSFVRTATPVMLAGSLALGLAYESGLLRPIEDVMAPAVGWVLGLPAVAGIALMLGFLRKELALQLLVVLAVAEYGQGATSIGSFMNHGQLFTFAIATAISIPCAATLASLVDEFGRRAATLATTATFGVGLLAAAFAARVVGIA